MTPSGSSWKLSGASQWSSTVTNVSKKRHVLRAIRRIVATSVAVSTCGSCGVGTLTRHAMYGERIHATRSGAAEMSDTGSTIAAGNAMTSTTASPIHIRCRKPADVEPRRRSASAAVSHSSRFLCEKSIRHSARTIASSITAAWCGSTVRLRSARAESRQKSLTIE